MHDKHKPKLVPLIHNVNVIHTRYIIDIKSIYAKKLRYFIYKKKIFE